MGFHQQKLFLENQKFYSEFKFGRENVSIFQRKKVKMARPLDYNKWNNIEVSDDEDDTHPNIDTPSLFKWRHEARVKRMEELDAKKKAVADEKKKKEQEIDALKKKMTTTALSESEMAIIKKGLNELEKEAKQAKQ